MSPDLPAPVARAIAAVNVEVVSDGFNGFSRFVFEVAGDTLRGMAITA